MTRAQARDLAGTELEDTGLQLLIDTVKADRSIPACTGEPHVRFFLPYSLKAYPRSYGKPGPRSAGTTATTRATSRNARPGKMRFI